MIRITQDQLVPENANLRVAAPSGDYEDAELIPFYDIETPELVAGAFQAQFMRYGSVVYQYNEAEELGRAILEVDPDATHAAASYVRMSDTLLGKLKSGALEPASLRDALADEQTAMDAATNAADQVEFDQAVEDLDTSPAAEPAGEVLGEVSAPTDVPVSDVSSTTPAVAPEAAPDPSDTLSVPAATTTPAVETLIEAATSTPDVVSYAKKRAVTYAKQKVKKRLLG